MTATDVSPEIPDHVDASRVIDFNVFGDARTEGCVHAGFKTLHQDAPDIFYSPRNGGHWMVTRFDTVAAVLRDIENFSSTQRLPKTAKPYRMIPLNLDPPDHGPYRLVLMRYFSNRTVQDLEPKIRDWARRLIDRVVDRGSCDFTEELAGLFPVSVFMEMMGLPLDQLEEFRGVVVEYFGPLSIERRLELENKIHGWMKALIDDRRVHPRDDLASRLLAEQVDGRSLTDDELKSMTFLMFIAGMDTVANAMMFAFHHLAGDRELQARLATDPERIPDFVEESLRRFSIINATRMVKQDVEVEGVQLRSGDMVVCSAVLAGLDERKNACPEAFDIDRKDRAHLAFSTGAHLCAGQHLGRSEMRIFTEEWLKRVPRFAVRNAEQIKERSALVLAMKGLELEWPASA